MLKQKRHIRQYDSTTAHKQWGGVASRKWKSWKECVSNSLRSAVVRPVWKQPETLSAGPAQRSSQRPHCEQFRGPDRPSSGDALVPNLHRPPPPSRPDLTALMTGCSWSRVSSLLGSHLIPGNEAHGTSAVLWLLSYRRPAPAGLVFQKEGE